MFFVNGLPSSATLTIKIFNPFIKKLKKKLKKKKKKKKHYI